jgi:hypothetical protein
MLDLNLSIFENLLAYMNSTCDVRHRAHSGLLGLSDQMKRWKSQTENLLRRLDGSAALVGCSLAMLFELVTIPSILIKSCLPVAQHS